MTLRESLHVMRRWRSVIVAGVLIGFVVGWVSAPPRPPERAGAGRVEPEGTRGRGSGPGGAPRRGAFGLLRGIGAAFGIARFDNRLGSNPAAEEVLGVPVIVEVPSLPRADRG